MYNTINQMVINNRKPHHGQSEAPSAGVTLVAVTNIHLHALGNVRDGLQVAGGLAPPHHPGFGCTRQRFTESYSTISQIVQYDIPNRIVRYFKSYRTISQIVQYDIPNRTERYSTTGENGAYCSFLILVDYTFVLNLDKVDSVKH